MEHQEAVEEAVEFQDRLIVHPDRHLQCEKWLGLAGGNTKKRGNKKSGESITPIRYNVTF